ncbi:hypothetical protein M5G07_00670 [Serratia symbiotica]|nr:hypothetical protein [Serratia symbiotica]
MVCFVSFSNFNHKAVIRHDNNSSTTDRTVLPLLIVGLTVVVVMLGIAWRRDYFINATLTVIGLNLALLSLYFFGQAGPMDVTTLLRVDGYAMFYTGG